MNSTIFAHLCVYHYNRYLQGTFHPSIPFSVTGTKGKTQRLVERMISSRPPPPPIPALPKEKSLLSMSITPPPLPPARSSVQQGGSHHQSKLGSNPQVSNGKRSENYYITSSLISRVSSKDQLSSSDSVNNLTRIGQAARMKRCMSSTSPLSSASTCSNSSTTSSNNMDVQVDVHPVPDHINYTEIDHDKDDEKGEMKKISSSSYLSQSQTSLSGSSSFFMDDDNWYSELIMNNVKPIIKINPSNNHQIKYNGIHGNKYNNQVMIKVKRSSTFNSDEDDGCDGGVPSTTSSTDSPSDQLLESMLREKDSEIALLRETLEQNEQVSL